MNVYDFDGTLYKGESCFDFALYCIIKKPKVLIFFLDILKMYKKHKKNQIDMDEANKLFKRILNTIFLTKEELDNMIQLFWKKHEKKLNWQLINKMTKKDIIISASPNFLLEQSPIKDKNIFCSNVDLENKKVLFFCYGKNKRKLFKEKFKNKKINKFYTDSYSDSPLMELSKEVYLVKKGRGVGKKIT